MIRRSGPAALAILAILLAGCGTPAGPAPSPPSASAVPDTLAFGACVDIASYFQAPREELAREVPAPLTPSAVDAAGLLAQRWIVAARCAVDDPNWTGGEARFFLQTIKVDAPETPGPDERRVTGGSFVVAASVDRADLAAALAAWGMAGVAVAEVALEDPAAATRLATARAGPDGPTMTVAAAAPPVEVGVEHERFFLPDGEGGLGGAFDLVTRPGAGERGPATFGDERPGRGGWFSGDGYGYTLARTPAAWMPDA